MSDTNSDSDSYSSDDDYLTSFGQGLHDGNRKESLNRTGMKAEEEREAIIRRKLMESFYGKAAVSSAEYQEKTTISETTKTTNDEKTIKSNGKNQSSSQKSSKKNSASVDYPSNANANGNANANAYANTNTNGNEKSASDVEEKNDIFDFNAPAFSSQKYTRSLLLSSNTETLLKNDESLALDIRQLDSTMQTLVYENYSKFIDATDAVRLINQSVDHSAEHGLHKLQSSMESIQILSTKVNSEIHSLRKQVADKLEIKNHLERLAHLLNLPSSLEQSIEQGKYRLAAKRHNQASKILSKHSDGFESLIQIEAKCKKIMEDMLNDLIRKLLTWSGNTRMAMQIDDESSAENIDLDQTESTLPLTLLQDSNQLPPMPNNVAEIFECAGTFDILSTYQSSTLIGLKFNEFTSEKCKPLALKAVENMLGQILDVHRAKILYASGADSIEKNSSKDNINSDGVYDDEALGFVRNSSAGNITTLEALRQQQYDHPETIKCFKGIGEVIISTEFLDKILETCTLFGVTYCDSKSTEKNQHLLNSFVSQSYSKFLNNVKIDLSEINNSINKDNGVEFDKNDNQIEDSRKRLCQEKLDNNDAFAEISNALTHLIRSTRDLANGLALPEVGIDMSIASGLVDQTVELTETMIQRYIFVCFHTLRSQAIADCISPFIQQSVSSVLNSGGNVKVSPAPTVTDVVREASMAIAEIMQLADSKINQVAATLSSAPVESAMIKLSIQKNACRFAMWLASTFETLAGCDTIRINGNDEKKMLYVEDKDSHENNDDAMGQKPDSIDLTEEKNVHDFEIIDDDMSDGSFMVEDDNENDFLYCLVMQLEDAFHVNRTSGAQMTLALAQVCRMAEKSVIETINSSISSSLSKDHNEKDPKNRFSRTLQGIDVDAEGMISKRFQIAAKRILALYAMDQGSFGSDYVCEGIHSDAQNGIEIVSIPIGPQSYVCDILEIVRTTSVDCTAVLGGSPISTPFQLFDNEDSAYDHYHTHSSVALGGTMTGVQLDIERMFAQKMTIFIHSIEFDREKVVCSVFLILFKAMIEHIRLCAFTYKGFRQLKVDVEFLRRMIPHYVGSNLTGALYDMLDDVMINARDRCIDKELVGDGTEFFDEGNKLCSPFSIIQQFMEEKSEVLSKFVINE